MQPIYERRPEYGTRSATDQKMGSGEGVETQDVYVQMQTILVNDCGIAPIHVLGSVSRDGLQPADPGVPPLKHEYEEARVGKMRLLCTGDEAVQKRYDGDGGTQPSRRVDDDDGGREYKGRSN
jgi:hypothetical protein